MYVCIYIYIYNIYIYIYIYMRKGRCGAEILGTFYVDKVCFAWARRYISKVMLLYCGKHHF